MTGCREVRDWLSEALDRPLPPEAASRLEAHLKECPACRAEQEELRWAHRHLRRLEVVEPPPWMTAKIMAKVRAEAAPSFWGRFLVPLLINPQFQVATILLVAATGYYVTRPQPRGVPARVEPQPDMESAEVAAPAPQAAPVDSLRKKNPAKFDAPAQPAEQEKREEKDHFAPAPAKERQDSVPSAPPAAVASEAIAPAAPGRASGAWLAGEPAADKKAKLIGETRATAELGQGQSGGAKSETSPAVIRLAPTHPQTVRAEVERAVRQVGGSILPTAEDSRGVTVRLGSRRLQELVILLGRTGRVLEQPRDPAEEPALMTVQVRW